MLLSQPPGTAGHQVKVEPRKRTTLTVAQNRLAAREPAGQRRRGWRKGAGEQPTRGPGAGPRKRGTKLTPNSCRKVARL